MIPDNLREQLQRFCSRHGLLLSDRYRDSEVISIQIIDDQATPYQLWLEHSNESWRAKAWDYKCNKTEHSESLENIHIALEKCYREILEWIESKGHTRTPA